MTEQIKYEAVFGDQSLFDDAADDVVLAIKDCGPALFYREKEKYPRGNVLVDSLDFKVAMRRIIKTPVWTKADQEAGRLPEVGCVVATLPEFECNVIGVDEVRKHIAIQYRSGKIDVVRVECIGPIETPEERAKRLREEWISKSYEKLVLSEVKGRESLGDIYDALLSGELKMPDVDK